MGYCMVEGIRCCGSFKGHIYGEAVPIPFLRYFYVGSWLTSRLRYAISLLFWAWATTTPRDNENAIGCKNSSPPVQRRFNLHLRLHNYDVHMHHIIVIRKHRLYRVRL